MGASEHDDRPQVSDHDRLLNTARNQARILDDGCTHCNGSKVYCRCVAWIDGPNARCCDDCDH